MMHFCWVPLSVSPRFLSGTPFREAYSRLTTSWLTPGPWNCIPLLHSPDLSDHTSCFPQTLKSTRKASLEALLTYLELRRMHLPPLPLGRTLGDTGSQSTPSIETFLTSIYRWEVRNFYSLWVSPAWGLSPLCKLGPFQHWLLCSLPLRSLLKFLDNRKSPFKHPVIFPSCEKIPNVAQWELWGELIC